MTYHVTTPIDSIELAEAAHTAKLQDECVMAIFRFHRRAMSPSQVHEAGLLAGRKWLLTSVRRSMSNLAAAGALEHLDLKRPGLYGRAETLWRLPDSVPVQSALFMEARAA